VPHAGLLGLTAALALTLACGPPQAPPSPVAVENKNVPENRSEKTWLKGQLHLHTANSGDSATPAPAAMKWYAAHGFDFVVVTDHNFVTVTPDIGEMLAIPGVELTQNLEGCEPAPEPGLRCLLHVNALFVTPERAGQFVFRPAESPRRADLFARALTASAELGGIAALNHPNFHYAADGALLGELAGKGLGLFELANAAIDSNNEGDATHPSTEVLWDAALASGARLFAIATDDAHHYEDAAAVTARGETAYVGDRGFVMVQAERSREAIRAAVGRGEFYASTGLTLRSLSRTPEAIAVATDEPATIAFIGAGGSLLRKVQGTEARMSLSETDSPYLRARVRAADGRTAWVQPIWR
jgi:hypothetical protein